ncbi:MAG: M3 family oligoendopeptidase, partial [Ginsengibacter sp.]
MNAIADIKKSPREYLPENLMVSDWASIEPYFKELLEREILSKNDMEKWLKDMSELEAMLNEEFCWRQIRVTCDTTDKKLEEDFNSYCMEIHPKIQPYAFEL